MGKFYALTNMDKWLSWSTQTSESPPIPEHLIFVWNLLKHLIWKIIVTEVLQNEQT